MIDQSELIVMFSIKFMKNSVMFYLFLIAILFALNCHCALITSLNDLLCQDFSSHILLSPDSSDPESTGKILDFFCDLVFCHVSLSLFNISLLGIV